MPHPLGWGDSLKRVKSASDGKYFVLGDKETLYGEDSREFGSIDEGQILGKVLFKI